MQHCGAFAIFTMQTQQYILCVCVCVCVCVVVVVLVVLELHINVKYTTILSHKMTLWKNYMADNKKLYVGFHAKYQPPY